MQNGHNVSVQCDARGAGRDRLDTANGSATSQGFLGLGFGFASRGKEKAMPTMGPAIEFRPEELRSNRRGLGREFSAAHHVP